MRPSPVDPFTPDPSELHPMLQKALDNLDVQLEDELTRYRQNCYRQLGQRTRVQDLGRTVRRNEASRQTSQAPFMPSLSSQAKNDPGEIPARDRPANFPAPESDVWGSEAQPPQLNLAAYAKHVVRERRPLADISQSTPDPQPELTDDYFASSEELLKSFSQPEDTPIRRQSALLDQLLTPLGVGSMLLILLSSVSLGYVLVHPSSLGFLAALGRGSEDAKTSALPSNQSLSPDLASDEFIDVNLNTLSQLPRSARPSTVVTVPQTASPVLQASPEVSSSIAAPNEIPRLSSAVSSSAVSSSAVSSSAIGASPLQTVTIPAAPVVRQAQPAPPPSRSLPATPRPAVPRSLSAPAAAPASKPLSAAAAPAPALISEAPPVASSRYYVVTEYTGDPSLSQARQAIGDAYVRNFDDGAKVQMGSFSDAASAEQLVRQLQQRGVPAQVYQP
jgi:SPOR domain